MSSLKTVAIFADGGFLSHVTRSFEVGRTVARCFGHRVVFVGEGAYMHIPRNAGFEVRPVYTVDREVTMKLIRRAGLCSLSWWRDECDRLVRSDLDVLGELKPDLVVGDMRWSLCTSARVLKIPYVAITNAAWTRWYAEPIELPAGHLSTHLLGDRLSRRFFPKVKNLLTWYYSLGYTDLRKRYGLPPVNSIFDLIEGDMTLLADIPEYMPLTADAPPSFRYVGPILWQADLPVPSWLARIDPNRPTLYFTMGSTGDTQFFDEAIRVFGDSDYQILITTGDQVKIPNPPSNIFVEDYAPGQVLMAVADAVVSHGGNGTVYQALSSGVPTIGFPSIFDQEINMQRVCALGAGVRMWRSQYSALSLKRAVETVLGDPSYRTRCAALSQRIEHMGGQRCAAVHIDHLLNSRRPDDQPSDVTALVRNLPAA